MRKPDSNLLLTGPPGSGKSTAMAAFVALAREAGVPAGGILTNELRQAGTRVGFEVIDVRRGHRAVLAHVASASPVRVGRYGVDVEAFARVGMPALTDVHDLRVVVVDEIAPMALACPGFTEQVVRLLEAPASVVAAVMARADPFANAIKGRDDVQVLTVDAASRDDLPGELMVRLGLP